MSATIRCLPKGICSWDYAFSGDEIEGDLSFESFGEKGGVTINGTKFDVIHQGWFSGAWSLRHEAGDVVTAEKKSAFAREFALETPDGPMVLSPEAVLHRSFLLRRSDETIAGFRPDHAFTRRATIGVESETWDSPVVMFSFWLVGLMWRRDAQSS